MRKIFYSVFLLIVSFSMIIAQTPKVKTGIEVLRDKHFDILKGKRVGLITNPTGVDKDLKSTVDILFEASEVKLVALYGPEHGVRGDFSAGEKVKTYKDPATQLPVYSLYGKTQKPTAEMLKDIDVLVYDIQDNGCRSYTYISTMGVAMEAAAENNKEFVVLDRPNPLTGEKVEGNLVEDGFISFVSQFKIPYVYGLTCGELAKMLNEEAMLSKGVKCKLTVVPMEGWERSMTFEQTGLPWVPASPHVPHKDASEYYVATGVLGELGVISEGVGYTVPFEIFAANWIDQKKLADKMNALNIEGVKFRPLTFKPYYGAWAKKDLHGVQIHIFDMKKVNLLSLQYLFLQVNNELYPNKNPFKIAKKDRIKFFDKVAGTSKVRELFSKNMKYDDIKDFLNKDIEAFREKSKKYFMY
ncbi:MAG: exo-beta-N-acetylmuramidase NamZ domain-containing protein [Clostridiales bacterium]